MQSVETIVFFLSFAILSDAARLSKCRDKDMNCAVWVATDKDQCSSTQLVAASCDRTCGFCGEDIEPRFDVRLLPKELRSLAWLVGRWRSEFGGKAFFPTIPKFTYGEQINFEIVNDTSRPSLNYTAFAWDINMPDGDPTEIHSENGYLAMEPDGTVTLTTAMSNGFMTVELGDVGQNQVKFSLQRIGRISFSHDSAVRTVREKLIRAIGADVSGLDNARREKAGGTATDDNDCYEETNGAHGYCLRENIPMISRFRSSSVHKKQYM